MFVKEISDLRAHYTQPDGTYAFVVDTLSVFKFDADSEEADDDETVIRPVMSGAGRWILNTDLTDEFAAKSHTHET